MPYTLIMILQRKGWLCVDITWKGDCTIDKHERSRGGSCGVCFESVKTLLVSVTNYKGLMLQKELKIQQRQWIKLIKDHDCMINYYSEKANVVEGSD
jgi:hypothetical protein